MMLKVVCVCLAHVSLLEMVQYIFNIQKGSNARNTAVKKPNTSGPYEGCTIDVTGIFRAFLKDPQWSKLGSVARAVQQ